MAFVCETVSWKGWSQSALVYLLYLAEHPLANSHEICDAIGISYRGGRTANVYRRKYNMWRECEAELRESPEACALFIARMNLGNMAASLVKQVASGKDAAKAASLIRQLAKPTADPKPDTGDWESKIFGSPLPAMEKEGVLVMKGLDE